MLYYVLYLLAPTEYRSLCEVRPISQEKPQISDENLKQQGDASPLPEPEPPEQKNFDDENTICTLTFTEKTSEKKAEYEQTEDLSERLNNDEKNEDEQFAIEDTFHTANDKEQFENSSQKIEENEESDFFKEEKGEYDETFSELIDTKQCNTVTVSNSNLVDEEKEINECKQV